MPDQREPDDFPGPTPLQAGGLFGLGCAWTVVVLALVFVVVAGLTYVWAVFEGPLHSAQYKATVHNQSYAAAQNQRCEDDIQQFDAAKQAGDQVHMRADYQDCRVAVGPLNQDEIYPDVQQFLKENAT